MAPVQQKIHRALQIAGGDLSVNDLVKRVLEASQKTSEQQVRSAVLPMISSDRIELTPNLKLRLRHRS
jgi:hypothetical protein